MTIKDSKINLIHEEKYQEEMRNKVEPFLHRFEKEMRIQREKGRDIYCLCFSQEEPDAVVVIAHGFTETSEKYRELAYYFLQRNYAVYVPDQCGHGRSYRLTDHSYMVHTDNYERYRDDLLFVAHTAQAAHPGLPLYLYGHSMGGGITASAAAAEPDLFSKLVLSSPMIRPATGSVPWFVSKLIAQVFCKMGKSQEYIIGQGPFRGPELFEESASSSRARFAYYQEKRAKEPLYQMSGASYGWLHAAAELNSCLQKRAWKQIQCPVLLFQAENDEWVSCPQQDLFIEKLGKHCEAKQIRIPGVKHELCNTPDCVFEDYLDQLFSFLEGTK